MSTGYFMRWWDLMRVIPPRVKGFWGGGSTGPIDLDGIEEIVGCAAPLRFRGGLCYHHCNVAILLNPRRQQQQK